MRLAVGGDIDGFESYDAALRAEDGCRHRRPRAGAVDALHVGHDRTAEGRAPCRAAGQPGSRRHRRSATMPGESRAPLHRSALPRGAARVLARRSADRGRRRRADGQLDGEDTLRLIDEASRHPLAHGADDVPPPALACPTTCARRPTCRRCASWCTVPHRARSGEAGDDRVVGAGAARVLRRHRGLGHVRHERRVADQAGHGRQAQPARPDPHPSTTTATICAPGAVGTVYLKAPTDAALRLLQGSRARRPRATAATTSPSATSATSTTTATCSSPTARRISSSRAASTSIPRRSRPSCSRIRRSATSR